MTVLTPDVHERTRNLVQRLDEAEKARDTYAGLLVDVEQGVFTAMGALVCGDTAEALAQLEDIAHAMTEAW